MIFKIEMDMLFSHFNSREKIGNTNVYKELAWKEKLFLFADFLLTKPNAQILKW